MAIFHIDSFYPTTGSAPTNEYDATTGIYYSSWETDDEARFSFTIPDTYDDDSGTNEITLRIDDSTPETTNKHRWQATVYLLRDGIDNPLSPTVWSVRASDYDPASTASELTTRTLDLTSSGQVGGDGGTATDVSAGDTLAIILKRVAPVVGSDDSNAIKNLGMAITFTVSGEDISECSGRAGAIMDEVYEMFQDTETSSAHRWLTDALILRWINRCYEKIARKGLFTKTGALTLSAGTGAYIITENFSDCIYAQTLIWTSSYLPLEKIQSREQFDRLLRLKASGTPEFYLIEGGKIHLGPVPDSASDTITVTYAYMPDRMDCATYINPITPQEHDDVFVHFCLFRAFMQEERDGTRTRRLSSDYYELYKSALDDLLASYRPAKFTRRV